MGGGNCLFGTEISEDKTIPLFRGNVSMVEIKSPDTNPTSIPNTGIWRQGAVDSTKYFDISIAGKCETATSDKVKLDIQPASQIPDFFTKNIEGKIVFAAPQVVGTIKAAKGHNSWVKIELKTVNGNITSDVAKHVCLGIKKNDEVDFFDIIHAGNLASMYVDVTQESYIELIPLLSKTATTEGSRYVAVTPSDEVSFTDLTIPTTGEFNFGSVYRVNISVHNSQWVTEQKCDLQSILGRCINSGRIGVGPVVDQNGNLHENQLFAIGYYGALAFSSDGAHWNANGTVSKEGDPDKAPWHVAPAYGNGMWCALNYWTPGVRRSINKGRSWSSTLSMMIYAYNLNFGNGIFITIPDPNGGTSRVYTSSPDAETWTSVGSINSVDGFPKILIYGDNKWICGSTTGYVYCSKDGKGIWEQISDELHKISIEDDESNATSYSSSYHWYGGCHVNGYFYVVRVNGLIARSPDGIKWERVFDTFVSGCNNVTYYKNKLWLISGSEYSAGLFNPDGTLDADITSN